MNDPLLDDGYKVVDDLASLTGKVYGMQVDDTLVEAGTDAVLELVDRILKYDPTQRENLYQLVEWSGEGLVRGHLMRPPQRHFHRLYEGLIVLMPLLDD